MKNEIDEIKKERRQEEKEVSEGWKRRGGMKERLLKRRGDKQDERKNLKNGLDEISKERERESQGGKEGRGRKKEDHIGRGSGHVKKVMKDKKIGMKER